MSLQLAFIMPTKYLNEFDAHSDYSFVEAEIYRKDKKYRKYFRRKQKEGRFTLLDNSVYLREGIPLEPQAMVEIIKDLHPDEVVAPDVHDDWRQTLLNAREFKDLIEKEKLPVRIMCAPQGKSFSEWMTCYQYILEESLADTIGICMRHAYGEKKDDSREKVRGRQSVLQFLEWNGWVESQIDYHTLGLINPIELNTFATFAWIRSNDSSVAVKYGLRNVRFSRDGLRQKKKLVLDFSESKDLTPAQKEAIIHNIKQSRDFCI